MGWGEVASAEPQSRAVRKNRSNMADKDSRPAITGTAVETGERLIKRAMVLDMGEASREQGFRLNGCR